MTLTCSIDESNPTAIIVWTSGGAEISAFMTTTEFGNYNAKKRHSELRVTADRTMNGDVYECMVQGTSISQAYTIDVTCKFMLDKIFP